MSAESSIFDAVVLPVASEDDARATCRAARDHLERSGGRAVFVHVIEKGGGVPDKASVEQREEYADDVLDAATECLNGTGVDIETRVTFGTDVAEAIFEVADELDATAIVFTPRKDSWWMKLLSGDVEHSLVTETTRPVVVLPEVSETDD